MINLNELLFRSEIKTAILQIANNLQEDESYSTQNAIDDLFSIIEEQNL